MGNQAMNSTEQTINTISTLIVVVIFVFYARQMRQQRALAREMNLPRGQRMRTVAQQWLDPVIIVLIAGVLLYQDLTAGSAHIVAAAIGLVIGMAFGWMRGRLEYVRYVPEHNAMILRITVVEVVMILVLVLIKVVLSMLGSEPNGVLMLVISAAIFLDVGDSIGKSAHLTRRFRQDQAGGQQTLTQSSA